MKKVHFTFDDGREMVEEWAVKTDVLAVRKWRQKTTLGRTSVSCVPVIYTDPSTKRHVRFNVQLSSFVCAPAKRKAALAVTLSRGRMHLRSLTHLFRPLLPRRDMCTPDDLL